MLREIHKVVQWLMLLRKQRDVSGQRSSAAGGLLVLLRSRADNHTCTVAAAGPWCADIKLDEVQQELYQILFPSAVLYSASEPDIQELRGFTEMYGPPHFLLSLQARVGTPFSPEWRRRVDDFLHGLRLVNAGVNIHLKLNSDEEKCERIFSGKIQSKVMLKDQSAMILDVTCSAQPPACIGERVWCQGGHPDLGARLPITIPPEAMDRGLFGELSLQPLTIISPCVLPYPNLATRLTQIQVLVYSPSNLPILGPSAFLSDLPASLNCQDLGLSGLHCSTSTDRVHSGDTVYSVEHEHSEELETEWSTGAIEQSLTLYLFLQHSDPFTIQLSDVMATEELLERHLEDILSHNKQAITIALQTQLKNTLQVQRRRHKAQEKLCSALEVIVSSAISIVSGSSNVDFRSACLDSMRVHDTHELSTSLHETMKKVMSCKKLVPRRKCYLAQMDTPPDNSNPTRREV